MQGCRTASVAALLVSILSSIPLMARADQRERWTLSTQAGTATLALLPEAGVTPTIMFICGVRFPGTAQVIVSKLDPDLAERRLRIDLESGAASAMTSAERSPDLVSRQMAALGEISIEQMTAIMRSPSAVLSWRVEAYNSFRKPHTVAPLPHPLSRHRTEFLRFCA
jgi:hypothetical protein